MPLLSILREILNSLDGHIAQYLGDGILTYASLLCSLLSSLLFSLLCSLLTSARRRYFGFPESDPDAAQHAVEAGLEIIAALPKLNRELLNKGLKLSQPLRIRLGLHSGSVVIGAMGGGNRTETLALGDVPNIAARMESLSPTNGMAITPAIKDAVEHKFVCKPLIVGGKSSHFVKGIKQAIEVFTIDSHKNAGAGEHSVDLVGRTAELGQLEDQWQMLQMGQGQAVVVTGGAGIGKTALTSAFAQGVRADESKPVVMLLKASEHRKSSPLFTAAQVLKRWASAELGERAQVRRALKDAGLEDRADTLSAPLLAVLGIEGSESSIPFGDSKAALIEVLTALPKVRGLAVYLQLPTPAAPADHLLSLALASRSLQYKPLMIVVEDTEQIDAMSLELFDELAKQLGSLKLFLVMCWRNDAGLPAGSCLVDWMEDEIGGAHIHVGKMSKAEAEEMAEVIAEGKALPKEVVAHVVKHGEGVPLHLEQLTRSVLVSDVLKLSADGGSYTLTGNLSDLALPTSLENAIRANMDALFKTEPDVKLLIELCAVVGGNFTMSVMKELWGMADGGDDDRLSKALMIAMKKKMLTSMSSKGYAPVGRSRKSSIGENMQFAFVHLRILDVAKGMLLKQQKVQLHEIVYEVLSSDGHNTPPEELAIHKEGSGELKSATALLKQALEFATEKAAYGSANELACRGVKLTHKIEESEQLDRELAIRKLQFLFSAAVHWTADVLATDKEELAKMNGEFDVLMAGDMFKGDVQDLPVDLLTLKFNAISKHFFSVIIRTDNDVWPNIMRFSHEMAEFSKRLLESCPDTVRSDAKLRYYTSTDWGTWCWPPDFDRRPELADVKKKIDEEFPEWRDTGKPYESGSLVAGIRDAAHWRHVLQAANDPDVTKVSNELIGGIIFFCHAQHASGFYSALLGDLDTAEAFAETTYPITAEFATSEPWNAQAWVHYVNNWCWWFMHKSDVDAGLLESMFTGMQPAKCDNVELDVLMPLRVHPFFGLDDDFSNPVSQMLRTYLTRGWLGVVLHELQDPSVKGKDILIPAPESFNQEVGIADPQSWQNVMFMGRMTDPNMLAAEVLLQFGRYDEAMAHAKQFEADCLGSQVPCWAPWLQGRIMGRKAQSKKAPKGKLSESKEAFSLLQRAHAAAKAWGSPLIATLAVQEMIALCPKQAAANNAESLFEEERFELIMEKESPMRTHIESGGTFAPMGL